MPRASASAEPAATRPSRKRNAPENDATESEASKRPRRVAASTTVKNDKPAPNARSSRASTASKTSPAPANAKKGAAASAATKAKAASKTAPTKKKTTTATTAKSTARPPVKEATNTAKVVTAQTQTKPKVARVPKPKAPPLNALPKIPSPRRWPVHVLVFGNGDAGQFGLGPNVMDELGRPKIHEWIEEHIEDGTLGKDKKGLETIVAGGMHSVAIAPTGQLWSWGVNDEGALGRNVADVPNPDEPGETIDREELESWPMVVEDLEKQKFRPVSVSLGDSFTFALDDHGRIKGWGIFRASNGKLGFVDDAKASQVQYKPISIPFLDKVAISSIECSSNHILALTDDGKVYVWGAGEEGQLGRKIMERRVLSSTRPDKMNLRNIVHIGAGFYHSFAVDKDGEVFAWGLNQYGQLGLEVDRDETMVWAPTHVPSLDPSELGGARVIQIAGGEHHTVFLLSDGRVFVTGRCDNSQLGLADDHPAMIKLKADDADHTSTPARVFFPPPPSDGNPTPPLVPYSAAEEQAVKNFIVKVSVSARSTLALSRDGNVYAWGYGASCQLGLGADTEESEVPQRVRWTKTDEWFAEDISAGGQHCFVVASKKADRNAVLNSEKMDESP